MSEPDVVEALTRVGFSLNEGRAYAALLQQQLAFFDQAKIGNLTMVGKFV